VQGGGEEWKFDVRNGGGGVRGLELRRVRILSRECGVG